MPAAVLDVGLQFTAKYSYNRTKLYYGCHRVESRLDVEKSLVSAAAAAAAAAATAAAAAAVAVAAVVAQPHVATPATPILHPSLAQSPFVPMNALSCSR